MQKNNFDIVVKNLSKYKNKLIEIDKVKEIVKKILDNEYSENKAYKMIYHLKNKWHLLNLKKGIFLVKNPEKEYQEQQFYKELTGKDCADYLCHKLDGKPFNIKVNIHSMNPVGALNIQSVLFSYIKVFGGDKSLIKTYLKWTQKKSY